MNTRVDSEMEDELFPEYDFAQLEGGVRGKYVERYQKGTNLVFLAPDVVQSFPTEDDINGGLQFMKDTFHLIDLISQAGAVQSLLRGKSTEEKIEWLSVHGSITSKPKTQQDERQCFWFESPTKVTCCFFLDDDEFVFIGDHTTFKVNEH